MEMAERKKVSNFNRLRSGIWKTLYTLSLVVNQFSYMTLICSFVWGKSDLAMWHFSGYAFYSCQACLLQHEGAAAGQVCPTGRSSSGCDWLPIQISLMKLIAFFFNDFRCRWTPSISYDSCDTFHIHFSWDWPEFFWTSCPCLWDFNPLVSQSEISTVQPSFFQGPKWKTEVRLSETVSKLEV